MRRSKILLAAAGALAGLGAVPAAAQDSGADSAVVERDDHDETRWDLIGLLGLLGLAGLVRPKRASAIKVDARHR